MTGSFLERLEEIYSGNVPPPITPLQRERAMDNSAELFNLAEKTGVSIFVLGQVFVNKEGTFMPEKVNAFMASLNVAVSFLLGDYLEADIRQALTADMVRKDGTVNRKRLKRSLEERS